MAGRSRLRSTKVVVPCVVVERTLIMAVKSQVPKQLDVETFSGATQQVNSTNFGRGISSLIYPFGHAVSQSALPTFFVVSIIIVL